jgi:hypothetical protein
MSRCPPGRDDAARPLGTEGRDHEEDSADRHADDSDPFFTVLEAGVDLLEPVLILNRGDGIRKVDAVPAAILGTGSF